MNGIERHQFQNPRRAAEADTRRWRAIGVLTATTCVAAAVTACSGSAQPAQTGSGTVHASTVATAAAPDRTAGQVGPGSSSTSCAALCATSDDGMIYRVTAVRRFTDAAGEPTIGVSVSMTNASSVPHVFEPFGGGFGATLTDTPDVQYSDFRGAKRSGDANCYTGSILVDEAPNAPAKIDVRPGQTVALTKQMCFIAPGGQKLTSVALIDDDGSTNADIPFDPPR